MRLEALIVLAAFVACKPAEKTSEARSGGDGTPPGEVKIDPNQGDADDGQADSLADAGLDDGAEPDAGRLGVVGQVAVDLSLTDIDTLAKVVAFQVSGTSFYSSTMGSALTFPIEGDGTFDAQLPKVRDDGFFTQFFRPDGSIDVQLVKQKYPPQDTSGKTDSELVRMVIEGQAYYDNIGYLLVATPHVEPTDPADWQSRLAARKDEANAFHFIALNSADNGSFLGLPVQKSKVPMLDVGALATGNDEVKSQVAVSEAQFAVPQAALDEFATSSDSFKRVKNAYINFDPIDKKEFNVLQVFTWVVDDYATTVEGDGFSSTSVMKDNFRGYTVRFETNRPELTLAKACVPGAVRLYPPVDASIPFTEIDKNPAYTGPGALTGFCPDANSDSNAKSRFFCHTNPASNLGVGVVPPGGTKCESNFADPDHYGYTADVETRGSNAESVSFLRMNWGGDSGFKGRVPQGLWRFEVDGAGTSPIAAWYDLAKGYPFDSNEEPTMYAPRLKVTRDGSKKVTALELSFHYWNKAANGGAGAYEPALADAVGRIMTRLPELYFNDQSVSGSPNGKTEMLQLTPVPGTTEARFDLSGYTFEDDWYIGRDNGGVVAAYLEIDNMALSWEAYGTSYRFVFRDHPIY